MSLFHPIGLRYLIKFRTILALLIVLFLDSYLPNGMLLFAGHAIAILFLLMLSPTMLRLLLLSTVLSVAYLVVDINWEELDKYGGFVWYNIVFLFWYYMPRILIIYAAVLMAFRKQKAH